MSYEYAYIVGLSIMGAAFAGLYWYRADLRRAMVWSGLAYFAVLSIGFLMLKIFFPDISPERSIIPGYWNPNTLFDLGRRTGGYGIEDAIYMFFTGGIAVAIYEELFRKHLGNRKIKHKPHTAFAIGALGAIFTAAVHVNLIYAMITSGFVGAIIIWFQRPDLIKHSLLGGASYLFVYFLFFLLFLQLYPDYIHLYYGVANLSGYLFFGIPIEEFLFAFSFGLMWSPIYEYAKDLR